MHHYMNRYDQLHMRLKRKNDQSAPIPCEVTQIRQQPLPHDIKKVQIERWFL